VAAVTDAVVFHVVARVAVTRVSVLATSQVVERDAVTAAVVTHVVARDSLTGVVPPAAGAHTTLIDTYSSPALGVILVGPTAVDATESVLLVSNAIPTLVLAVATKVQPVGALE
jgi:hypothetical protein